MAASGKLDLVRGDSHLAGNLLDGSLEGPLRNGEQDRPCPLEKAASPRDG
ncbi:hypothetical protein ACLI34_26425, partial [Pseudomonas aeruginosa]